MDNKRDVLVYKQKASWEEKRRYIKAILYPLGALTLSVYVIDLFGQWGRGMLVWGFAAIWFSGFLTTFFTSSSVGKKLDGMIYQIASYAGTLLAFRLLISVTSGVSSEMLSASFEQNVSLQQSNITSYLQNFLNYSAVLMPVTFTAFNIKTIFAFRKNTRQDKFFKQQLGVANNNRQK